MKKLILLLFLLPSVMQAQTIAYPVPSEYRCGYVATNDTLYSTINASSKPIAVPLPGSRKVMTAWGGFNAYDVVARDSTVWVNYNDFTTNWTQYATDTTGSAFNHNFYINAYAGTFATILGTDSTAWYAGDDTFHIFHTTGKVKMRPVQLSPAGMKVKKVLLGGARIVILTYSGQVWECIKNAGSPTFTQKTLPGLGYAIDIFNGHLNYAGCLIPSTSGAHYGYPYVWGGSSGAWGGNTAFTQPTSVTTLWGVTVPIKQIVNGWNTTHWIDSLGKMYGFGYNPNGEVGNGKEAVNQYTYSTFPNYSWTFNDGEAFSGVPATQIGVGTKWTDLYDNDFFVFYLYAKDSAGNLYSWGRNKAIVLGNGMINLQEASSPNSLDILTPTLVTPLTNIYTKYNFTVPTLSLGSNHSVAGTTDSLTATGNPATLLASGIPGNGITNPGYHFVNYAWSTVSGPNTPAFSNNNVSTPGTRLSGLIPGTYVIQVIATDNNTGTIKATVTITVTALLKAAFDPHAADESQSTVNFYPNPVPANQQLTVEGRNWKTGAVKLIIRDISGRPVKQAVLDNQSSYFRQTISVSGLDKGAYLLTVESAEGKKATTIKFIIK